MNELETKVKDFLHHNQIEHVVSFSGGFMGCDTGMAEAIIDDCMKEYKDKSIAILTGGTKWNLPNLAKNVANKYGLKTIGVLPERALKHKADNLDLELVVPSLYGKSEWCDESQVFAKLSDAMHLLGGGPGTAVEVFDAMKISLDRVKDEQKPIYLAPLSGFGGVEQMIYDSPFLEMAKDFLPQKPFDYGNEAAKYILNRL